nr:MAG TPA: hypothetical protein [Crassvirales sp.]
MLLQLMLNYVKKLVLINNIISLLKLYLKR